MSTRQAQEFRQRIIASEIENLPTGLLELLETAETIASQLVKTQNRIVEEDQKRIVPQKPSQSTDTQESQKSVQATNTETATEE